MSKKEKTTNISSEVPLSLHKKFHDIAKSEDRSASSLMRILMQEYIDKVEAKRKKDQ